MNSEFSMNLGTAFFETRRPALIMVCRHLVPILQSEEVQEVRKLGNRMKEYWDESWGLQNKPTKIVETLAVA